MLYLAYLYSTALLLTPRPRGKELHLTSKAPQSRSEESERVFTTLDTQQPQENGGTEGEVMKQTVLGLGSGARLQEMKRVQENSSCSSRQTLFTPHE
ncbi:hypothetical protein SRHO_G00000360 [Serrasalmus rhombeus]